MNSKLVFKVVFIFFLGCIETYAQNEQSQNFNQSSQRETLTFTQIGWLQPMSLGNNFASKGIDFNRGLDIQFNFYYDWLNLFFGVRFQNFSGEVTDTNRLGNYEKTRVNLYGVVIGYSFQMKNPKISIDPRFTLGTTVYRNNANFNTENNYNGNFIIENFRDTATTLMLSGTTNYKFTNNFAIYLQPEFRWDRMRIDAPEELSSFFSEAVFLNVTLGITLFL